MPGDVILVVFPFVPVVPFDDSVWPDEFDFAPPLFVDELFDVPLDATPFVEPLLLEPLLTEGLLDLKVELLFDACELLFEPSELLFEPIELVFFDPNDELLRVDCWFFDEEDLLELLEFDDPLNPELLLLEKLLAEPP